MKKRHAEVRLGQDLINSGMSSNIPNNDTHGTLVILIAIETILDD
jgi:hypothetical protein